jgi:chromosome segregation ATPase
MNPDNCPHCFSPAVGQKHPDRYEYTCGHLLGWATRTDLCLERQKNAKLREDLEALRKEYAAMVGDLECLQPHWIELSGVQSAGRRISLSVPDLLKAWKKAQADYQDTLALLERRHEQINKQEQEITSHKLALKCAKENAGRLYEIAAFFEFHFPEECSELEHTLKEWDKCDREDQCPIMAKAEKLREELKQLQGENNQPKP